MEFSCTPSEKMTLYGRGVVERTILTTCKSVFAIEKSENVRYIERYLKSGDRIIEIGDGGSILI